MPELAREDTYEETEGLKTAAGSSRMAPPITNPSDPAESMVEEMQGDVLTSLPTSEQPMTDDNFTLSDAASPVHDQPETVISHMDAADIESELNNLLTIDEASSAPSMIADPATTREPAREFPI